MLPIKDIEIHLKRELKNNKSVHSFGHLKRTATGAKWFAKLFGYNKKERDIAYLSGLIHDLKRPLSEKIEHSGISVREAEKILERFGVERDVKNEILSLIKIHRGFSNEPLFKQSVFLSDKILEQMGAYLVFRRCMYIGECLDFKNVEFGKAIVFHTSEKTKEYTPGKFLEKLRPLIEYQYQWLVDFLSGFKKDKKWAIYLAKKAYDNGRTHELSLDDLIKFFKPKFEEDERMKKEALDYINGKKFKEFERLIEF